MSQIRNQMGGLVIASILTFIAVFWMFSMTWAGTTAGLLFGGVLASLTLILGMATLGIQYIRQQSMLSSKQKSVDNLSSHQERTIEIDLPFDSAFDLAMEALQTLDNQEIPITVSGLPSKQRLKSNASTKSWISSRIRLSNAWSKPRTQRSWQPSKTRLQNWKRTSFC